jgi:hypothetical protein
MSAPQPELSPLVADVIAELQEAIRDRFPEATFDQRVAPDGRVYLSVYTTATNDFDVQDLATERTVDAFIRDDVKIHVFPRPAPATNLK